jgi:hypothetical protein
MEVAMTFDHVRSPARSQRTTAGPAEDPAFVCAVAALARGHSVAGAAAASNMSVRSLQRELLQARANYQARNTVHLVVRFVRAGLI